MTVSTAKIYNTTYTASSVGATKNALAALLAQAGGSESIVDILTTEKTGQQYEMTLLTN
jgi:hypothetical protein